MTGLLTYREAAEIMGVSVVTIKRIPWAELPRVSVSSRIRRISEVELAKYIRNRTRKSIPAIRKKG